MRRREFITLIGGATAAWPLAARAQQPAMPVIGFLSSRGARDSGNVLGDFHRGLTETGVVLGQNAEIIYSWAEGHYDRLPALAAELVSRQVAVIVATGGDPGGNATGNTNLSVELGPKRLELLHELVPTARVIGLLVNEADTALTQVQLRAIQSAANSLGLELQVLNASSERDFSAVFNKLNELRAGGLVISAGTLFTRGMEQLAALTVRHSVPAVYMYREFAAAGGLASYGGDITESYRLVGIYIGRIHKGEKPGDLPVLQPTKFELVINLNTAKALGITVSLPLSGRADEVIE